MNARILLLSVVAIVLGAFVIQEQFFATVPFCDRFAQVTVTATQVTTTICSRTSVLGTDYICSASREITTNTENYSPGTYYACQAPYRSSMKPTT